jgi:hypothetical protein
LVRPDGYVAWRHATSVTAEDDAVHLLGGAIETLLGRSADVHEG